MNRIEVQMEEGNPYKSGSAVYIDIGGGQRPQLAFNIEDYARTSGTFNLDAAEFAYFTSVIYGCDRVVNRESSSDDRWTREFAVQIPVADPGKWSATSNLVEPMLQFLTGDIWHLDFVAAPIPLFGREFRRKRSSFRKRTRVRGDAVSLYSGGLDSLIGVINWLEENPTASIVLASTYDAQAEGSQADQERLLPHLEAKYAGRIQRYVARTGLCVGGEDTNFRSRSLAFIGNAVLAASFLGDDTSIVIPENGAIALNYPLTSARRGSLSTRTVHPHFIAMLSSLLDTLGLRYPLNNPYLLKTKGEMMQECRNASLLRAAYADSASCGKRGYSRVYWEDRHARQCGVCVPCIFRRASIHSVGLPAEQYGNDLTPSRLMQIIQSQHNHDLSAVIDFIERNDNADTIWQTLRSNGRLDSSLKDQYISLIERLRDEVKSWVQSMGPL
jgi:7-cyano-7-deazaguanine synthase in queuosine biosynthesis